MILIMIKSIKYSDKYNSIVAKKRMTKLKILSINIEKIVTNTQKYKISTFLLIYSQIKKDE